MVRSVGVPAEQATARRGGRSLALAVLCTILFLTFLDNTIVSVGVLPLFSTVSRPQKLVTPTFQVPPSFTATPCWFFSTGEPASRIV